MACIRCKVSGLVQGVFFRATTQKQAQSLGLTGYANNLADGSVEVLACGEPDKVESLHDWLWQGPPASEVHKVECETVEEAEPVSFSIG